MSKIRVGGGGGLEAEGGVECNEPLDTLLEHNPVTHLNFIHGQKGDI